MRVAWPVLAFERLLLCQFASDAVCASGSRLVGGERPVAALGKRSECTINCPRCFSVCCSQMPHHITIVIPVPLLSITFHFILLGWSQVFTLFQKHSKSIMRTVRDYSPSATGDTKPAVIKSSIWCSTVSVLITLSL